MTTTTNTTSISVESAGVRAYRIAVHGHEVLVDQPIDAGGEDHGPQPLELFVGALAACVATLGAFLRRDGIDTAGLRVECEYELANDRPTRVGTVRIRVAVPDGVPADRRASLLAMARHCTAHNTLRQPPEVQIILK
jgi:putative redox protein